MPRSPDSAVDNRLQRPVVRLGWPLAIVLVLAGLACVATPAAAHPDHAAAMPTKPDAYYQPTSLPDRVTLTWSDDPATTLDITYRTHPGVTQTLAEWLPADQIVGNHLDGDIAEAQRIQGVSELFESDLGEARYHSIKLRGLTPSTRYAYRVGDGQSWSEWHHASTAEQVGPGDEVRPFDLLYFGDAQNAVRALWSRVRREAHAEAPRAAFALHAGDLINHANRDAEWGEWHGAAGWLNATVPTIAIPGNHEYAVRRLSPMVSGHWRPQFSFPTNGPDGLEETCFTFEYQGVRFVCLNSNERLEDQAEWLDAELGRLPPARWTIATFHHPVYSAARDRDNPKLRSLWRPLFDKHGIDLALQGHDHTYARTGPGGPSDAVGTENVGEGLKAKRGKTVYVVSVSGPKSYPLTETWEVARAASGVQLYQTIRVEHDRLVYRSYRATGELYDGFTIDKDAAGEIAFTEQAPETPEVRE